MTHKGMNCCFSIPHLKNVIVHLTLQDEQINVIVTAIRTRQQADACQRYYNNMDVDGQPLGRNRKRQKLMNDNQ